MGLAGQHPAAPNWDTGRTSGKFGPAQFTTTLAALGCNPPPLTCALWSSLSLHVHEHVHIDAAFCKPTLGNMDPSFLNHKAGLLGISPDLRIRSGSICAADTRPEQWPNRKTSPAESTLCYGKWRQYLVHHVVQIDTSQGSQDGSPTALARRAILQGPQTASRHLVSWHPD